MPLLCGSCCVSSVAWSSCLGLNAFVVATAKILFPFPPFSLLSKKLDQGRGVPWFLSGEDCATTWIRTDSANLYFSAWKGMFVLLDFLYKKWGIWCNHILQLPEPVAQITISWYTIILIGLGHLQCGLKSNRSRWKSNTTHCGSRLIVVRGRNRPPNTVRREWIKKWIQALRSSLSCGSAHNPKPPRLDE